MKIRIALLIALLLTLVGGSLVSAQSGGISYSSSFQVQNLSATTANVVLEFYNQDGTVAASKSYTVPANGNRTFFAVQELTGTFNGSLVISSDQDIRAINNLQGTGPGNYFESTNGFQAGSTSMSLPLIMCNNSGFNTWFNVQNAGASPAHITIAYTPGSAGVAGKSETATIAPGAAKTFDQALGSSTMNCSALATAGGKFIGSANITSDQPVAAVVMQVNTTTFKALFGYGGFAAGANTVSLPLIMAQNSNFYTAMQIQNVDPSASASVTVHYGPNTGGSFAPVDETFTLPAGNSKTVINNGAAGGNGSANSWTSKYIGSATVTSTGGKVVAIVNEQRAVGQALGSTYSGADPAAATAKISAPLIMAQNSSYYTAMQIQNVGTVDAQVVVHYSANSVSGSSFAPVDENVTIAAGGSKTIIQNGAAGPANGSVNNWTSKYIGSATISTSTSGAKIVAIVNQQSLTAAGDQLASNNAFNY